MFTSGRMAALKQQVHWHEEWCQNNAASRDYGCIAPPQWNNWQQWTDGRCVVSASSRTRRGSAARHPDVAKKCSALPSASVRGKHVRIPVSASVHFRVVGCFSSNDELDLKRIFSMWIRGCKKQMNSLKVNAACARARAEESWSAEGARGAERSARLVYSLKICLISAPFLWAASDVQCCGCLSLFFLFFRV